MPLDDCLVSCSPWGHVDGGLDKGAGWGGGVGRVIFPYLTHHSASVCGEGTRVADWQTGQVGMPSAAEGNRMVVYKGSCIAVHSHNKSICEQPAASTSIRQRWVKESNISSGNAAETKRAIATSLDLLLLLFCQSRRFMYLETQHSQ